MIWDISGDEKMKAVINQASKSWVMPTDISIDIYGIGEPVYEIGESTGAHDGDYYLDVANGKIYKFIIEVTNNSDGSTSYKPYWNLEEELVSVKDELDALNEELTVTSGNLALISNNFISEVSIAWKKQGNVILIGGSIKVGSTFSSGTAFFASGLPKYCAKKLYRLMC